MGIREDLLEQVIVKPGEDAGIAGRDSSAHSELDGRARDALERGKDELRDAQELLWATDRYAVLVVLQAMDAAGKDSAIEHVMSGVNPQGVQVFGFKKPSAEELDHDFLWRSRGRCPSAAGSASSTARTTRRSWRCKVHPEWLGRSGCRRRPRRGVLAGALRGHQHVRAPPRPQRDEGREAVPARLQGGAEGALPGQAGHARQGVEVQRRRRHRTRALGRLHGRVRACVDRHVDPVGAVVRHPGRLQGHHPGARRAGARGDAQLAGPELAGGLAKAHAANLEARRILEAEP